jgi:hypothetical protein
MKTTAVNRGSSNDTKPFNFTSTYKQIKASIVSVLMWLSLVGASL